MEIPTQRVYYAVFFVTKCMSLEEVRRIAPGPLAEHVARSKLFHAQGKLLLTGAFLDRPEEPVSTMGVLISREAAEEYALGDPFLLHGLVSSWHIREWANLLA